MNSYIDAISVFPDRLKAPLLLALKSFSESVYEIHLIANRCVFISCRFGLRFVSTSGGISISVPPSPLLCSFSELDEIVNRATNYSGFSHENELSAGFTVYGGGCRLGIVTDKNFSGGRFGKICSLCLRLPFYDEIAEKGEIYNILQNVSHGLLIAGRPASGKTTLLRQCARILAGGKTGIFHKVSVIDERSELCGGGAVFLGECANVIAGCSKREGIEKALRLMSPEIIICDEIGSEEESKAVLECLNSGVIFIASIHAGNLSELLCRNQFLNLFSENVFDRIVFLSGKNPGEISNVYTYEEVLNALFRNNSRLRGSDTERNFSVLKKESRCNTL